MKKHPYLFVLLAACLWGILSIFVRGLNDLGHSALHVVAIRVILSALLMIIICAFIDAKLLHIRLKDIWLFIGTGICSIVLFNYCYFTSIALSGVSTAALLLYTAPTMVIIGSCLLFREKLTKSKLGALIMTAIGLVFVTNFFTSGEKMSPTAILFGLGAGFGYALYSLFGKVLAKHYNPFTVTTYTFVVASIGIIPLVDINSLVASATEISFWGYGLGIALLCTVVPFLAYTIALENAQAGRASLVATLEPLVAALVGVFFFEETMGIDKILGMIFILGGVLLISVVDKKRAE